MQFVTCRRGLWYGCNTVLFTGTLYIKNCLQKRSTSLATARARVWDLALLFCHTKTFLPPGMPRFLETIFPGGLTLPQWSMTQETLFLYSFCQKQVLCLIEGVRYVRKCGWCQKKGATTSTKNRYACSPVSV